MNLYLHGAHDFSIIQGDTLRYPKFLKAGKPQTFDNVIANPPFGLSGWGAEAFEMISTEETSGALHPIPMQIAWISIWLLP